VYQKIHDLISSLKMNPPAPSATKATTLAYGPLLAEAGKLKRNDQVNLVRALAGQLGMIALFPNQLVPQSGPTGSSGKSQRKEKKGPAQQAPTNPLSGTPEKKAFDAAKKAVAKATKEGGGQKLASTNPLVLALERAKDQYFRSLSSAKGSKSAPTSWADDASAQADASAKGAPSAPPTPKATSPPQGAKKPSPKK
jgi:hypothetical protein